MEDEDNGDDWLLTYGDAVTLLMTFLVLLLSVSTIDQSKFDQVVESIKEQGLDSDKQFVSPFEQLKNQLEDVAENHELKDAMTVTRQPKGITIEVASSTLYPAGKADIQLAALPALESVASAIKDFKELDVQVEIEGHTDDVPIRTKQFPSNWELSVSRATNVIRFLAAEGIPNNKMKAAGYADTRPKVPNIDEQGVPVPENRAINRRVVIHVVRDE